MANSEPTNAVDIARRAIPFMSEKRIPITPKNYCVWYEYFRGRQSDLRVTLDELVETNTTFHEKLNDEIYARFFVRSLDKEEQLKVKNEMKTMAEISSATEELLQPITDKLEGLGTSNEAYSSRLKSAAEEMKSDKDMDQLHSIMIALAKETDRMSSESKAVSDGLLSTSQQINLLRSRLAEAKNDARTDDLTRVYNRRAFNERIVEETCRVNSQNDISAIAIVDIDKFKRINDQYGHPVGDKAIKAIASMLKESARDSDEIFRYGGEEFAILMKGTTLDKALSHMEQIREFIGDHEFVVKKVVEIITVSIGVATIEQGKEMELSVGSADEALYLAKTSGRNNVKSERNLQAADVKDS